MTIYSKSLILRVLTYCQQSPSIRMKSNSRRILCSFIRFLKFVATRKTEWRLRTSETREASGKDYSDDVKLSENRYSGDGSDLSERRKQNVVEKSRILLVAEETFVTSQIFEIERLEGKGGDLFGEIDEPFHGSEHRGPSRILLAK
ncbi:hypothetical protein K0M31_001120 [Melipona bicolor]|uniref:Uncharacterized protein n=1 Tax=Melipona bicolor TaxID=60889 RepID=A0AA40GF22_9HYME|nr:hypothetical protein K0M31_001120 [Melipona bicolor]